MARCVSIAVYPILRISDRQCFPELSDVGITHRLNRRSCHIIVHDWYSILSISNIVAEKFNILYHNLNIFDDSLLVFSLSLFAKLWLNIKYVWFACSFQRLREQQYLGQFAVSYGAVCHEFRNIGGGTYGRLSRGET